jgi:anaerobic ribonucleoside-triphosphate reductase activating protein
MLKYVNYDIVFQEIPNETTLAINISNCPCHCKGCHSPYLAKDIGTELTSYSLLELLKKNKGITCVAMMGGDSEPQEVEYFSELVRNIAGLRYAWYSGRQELPKDIDISKFDYIKLGPYVEELGGLKSPTTNQRFYEVQMSREIDENDNPIYGLVDVTDVFWK